MRVTGAGRKTTGRFAMEQTLAPQVEEVWAQSFCLELRLLGVEGARIGAALSEVESHCNDSGQSARLAFGTPVEYARRLQLPVDGDHGPRAVLRFLVPVSVQFLGMCLLLWSLVEWLGGQQLEVTTGHLVIAAAFLVTVIALVRYAVSVLRLAVNHRRIFPVIAVAFLTWPGPRRPWSRSGFWTRFSGAPLACGALSPGLLQCRAASSGRSCAVGARAQPKIRSRHPFDHEMSSQ